MSKAKDEYYDMLNQSSGIFNKREKITMNYIKELEEKIEILDDTMKTLKSKEPF